MKKILLTSAAALSMAAIALPGAAHAAIVIDIEQVGSDVIGTVSGSLDLTGLTNNGTILNSIGVRGTPGFFGGGANGRLQAYTGITGPVNWGTGGVTFPSSASGDLFAFNPDFIGSPRIFVPIGYASNSAISSTASFAGATLASLGLDAGVYSYTAPNDTITVNIGQLGAVPEPATWAFMIFGFGAIGGALRSNGRRQRKANVKVSYA